MLNEHTHGGNLRIHEVEAFRAVMIRGTATEAAVLLHTSQPVISKLIARFQRHIGIKLFELRKSRLIPTPEARILFNTIERTYVGLDHVAQTIAELRGGHSGRLVVGSLPSFAMGPLANLVADFIAERPDMRVSIETVNSSLIRHSVVSGKVDLGVALKSIDTTGVHVDPLLEVNTVCVMSASHPLASKSVVNVKDLHDVPMILPSRDSASYAALAQMFAKAEVTPCPAVETSYAMMMCILALQGAGAALVSPLAAMHLRDAGLLIKRFEPRVVVELVLLTPTDASTSRIASAFVERLHQGMADLRAEWG